MEAVMQLNLNSNMMTPIHHKKATHVDAQIKSFDMNKLKEESLI
jgi:hypothetical protein